MNKQAQYWYEAWQQQQRNTQRLMFENAQQYVVIRALLPALFRNEQFPTCVTCGLDLPPRGKTYCSGRCRVRAWRARQRAAA